MNAGGASVETDNRRGDRERVIVAKPPTFRQDTFAPREGYSKMRDKQESSVYGDPMLLSLATCKLQRISQSSVQKYPRDGILGHEV